MKNMKKSEIVSLYNSQIERFKLDNFKPVKANTWNSKAKAIEALKVLREAVNRKKKEINPHFIDRPVSKSQLIREFFNIHDNIEISAEALAEKIEYDRANTIKLIRIISNPSRIKFPLQGVSYDKKRKVFKKGEI